MTISCANFLNFYRTRGIFTYTRTLSITVTIYLYSARNIFAAPRRPSQYAPCTSVDQNLCFFKRIVNNLIRLYGCRSGSESSQGEEGGEGQMS